MIAEAPVALPAAVDWRVCVVQSKPGVLATFSIMATGRTEAEAIADANVRLKRFFGSTGGFSVTEASPGRA